MCIYLKTDSNPIKWQAALKSLEKYGYVWNGSRKKPLVRASEPKPYLIIWIKDKTITFRDYEIPKTKNFIEILNN